MSRIFELFKEATGVEITDENKNADEETRNRVGKSIHQFMASTFGVNVIDGLLVFTAPGTHSNWMYYAGFEYIDEDFRNKISFDGETIIWYDPLEDDSDRVAEMVRVFANEPDPDDEEEES